MFHSWEIEQIDDGVDFNGDTAYRFIVTLGSNNEDDIKVKNYLADLLEKGLKGE